MPRISINAEAVILSITEDCKSPVFLISHTAAQLLHKHTAPPLDRKLPAGAAPPAAGGDGVAEPIPGAHAQRKLIYTSPPQIKKKPQPASLAVPL